MKFYFSFLILASILATSLAQSTADEVAKYVQKFDVVEKAVCGATKISDDQLAEITNKCKCDDEAKTDALVKLCLKVTDLTARQKISSFCDKAALDCMKKTVTDQFSKFKPDEVAGKTKNIDTYLTCVKTILKVQ